MSLLALKSRFAARKPRSHAFTFLEILATLSLISVVLPTVMTGISMSLSAAKLAKDQSQASSLAYSKMTELIVTNEWQNSEMSGDFGDEMPGYNWSAKVTQWEGTMLEQLDVTVVWSHRSRERSVTLSTLVSTGASI